MYVSVTLSVHPTLSFSYYAHTSLLYVCISIPALQRGPSLPLRVKFSLGKTTTLVAFCTLVHQHPGIYMLSLDTGKQRQERVGDPRG